MHNPDLFPQAAGQDFAFPSRPSDADGKDYYKPTSPPRPTSPNPASLHLHTPTQFQPLPSIPLSVSSPIHAPLTPPLDPWLRWVNAANEGGWLQQEAEHQVIDWKAKLHLRKVIRQALRNAGVAKSASKSQEIELEWEDKLFNILVGEDGTSGLMSIFSAEVLENLSATQIAIGRAVRQMRRSEAEASDKSKAKSKTRDRSNPKGKEKGKDKEVSKKLETKETGKDDAKIKEEETKQKEEKPKDKVLTPEKAKEGASSGATTSLLSVKVKDESNSKLRSSETAQSPGKPEEKTPEKSNHAAVDKDKESLKGKEKSKEKDSKVSVDHAASGTLEASTSNTLLTQAAQAERAERIRVLSLEILNSSVSSPEASVINTASEHGTITAEISHDGVLDVEPTPPPTKKLLRFVLLLKREEARSRTEPRDVLFHEKAWTEGAEEIFDEGGRGKVWTGCKHDDEDIEQIGGTLVVKGPSREVKRLLKVVQLAVFAACNLELETHLLRDSSCSRPPPPSPSPPLPVVPHLEPEPEITPVVEHQGPILSAATFSNGVIHHLDHREAHAVPLPPSQSSTVVGQNQLDEAPTPPAEIRLDYLQHLGGSSSSQDSIVAKKHHHHQHPTWTSRARWGHVSVWNYLRGRSDSNALISPTSPRANSINGSRPCSPGPNTPTTPRPASENARYKLRAKAAEVRQKLGRQKADWTERKIRKRKGYADTDEWELIAGLEELGARSEESASESEFSPIRRRQPIRANQFAPLEAKVENLDTPSLVTTHHYPDPPTPTYDELIPPTPASMACSVTSVPSTPLRPPEDDDDEQEEPRNRFERVIKKMEKATLSVSPDVTFPPPHLLVRLRQQEIAEGADNSEPGLNAFGLGIGMAGQPPEHVRPHGRPGLERQRSYASADAEALSGGFARSHRPSPAQTIHAVAPTTTSPQPAGLSGALAKSNGEKKITVDARAGLASLLTNNSSLDGTLRHQALQFLVERSSGSPGSAACYAPQWITLRYYDDVEVAGRNLGLSCSIGEVVDSFIEEQDENCHREGCGKCNGDHTLSLVHNTMRIVLSVEKNLEKQGPTGAGEVNGTVMWTKCKVCGQCDKPVVASNASLLYAFPKLLELLLYDDCFVPKPQNLCEHGQEHHDALLRYFGRGDSVFCIAMEPVDLFELRLPTAIDASIGEDGVETFGSLSVPNRDESSEMVDKLGLEISYFFGSLKSRLDVLEEVFCHREERNGEGNLSAASSAPCSSAASQASSMMSDTENIDEHDESAPASALLSASNEASMSRARSRTIKAAVADHQFLLASLRSVFDGDEEDLRLQLSTILSSNLNNLRKTFVDRIHSARARLAAWEKKHTSALSKEERKRLESPKFIEPFYVEDGLHALPADNSVIVRENELSTIIAFTLSSAEYRRQLSSNKDKYSEKNSESSSRRPSVRQPGTDGTITKRDLSLPSSFFLPSDGLPDVPSSRNSPIMSPRSKPAHSKPVASDPDDPCALFGPDVSYEAYAVPKKPLKQATSILSLRALSKQRSIDLGSLRFGSVKSTPSKGSFLPRVSDEHEAELLKGTTLKSNDKKVLEDLIKGDEAGTKTLGVNVAPTPVASLLSRPAKPESGVTTVGCEMAGTFGVSSTFAKDILKPRSVSSQPWIPSRPPSFTGDSSSTHSANNTDGDHDELEIMADDDLEATPPASRFIQQRHPSSMLSAPFSALWSLGSMKLKSGDVPKGIGLDSETVSPHIKHRFRHGTKEFTCTIWHAEQFAAIRYKCGLSEDLLIESLSRCSPWAATGGKSKSVFLMTQDQRFVLKEMVSAWSVSERDALLAFAPSYFKYLSGQTNQKPSLLCKIFGFYTVKIKDTVKGENIVKLDLLLMEHLFHSHSVTRKFDLKGISTRVSKVKEDGKTSGTLWDADWIEGALRTLLLIHPHSKHVITSAVENDVQFLADSNVMDYSLLVGVDDIRRELIVGIVDVIGTFGLAKMIESRGKMALRSSDRRAEVTILPPVEYAQRFKKAMDLYFISVPEKWSRPLDPSPQEKEWHENPTLASVF